MKIKHIFSLAALTIMMAACSSDESTQSQPAPSGKTVPFKAVITAGNPDTRGLTEASDGKSITAKWEKEEKVALIHGETIDVLEVASVDADGNATITGTINNAVNEEKVYLVYVGHQHVSMANYVEYWTTNWKTYNPDTDIPASDLSHPVFELMATQSGTLEGIQDSLDFRYSPAGDQAAKMVVSDDGATLADNVKLLTKYSIWKLNLTTNGTTALKASKFVMTDASENQYTVDLGESTASEFYLAFLPDSNTGYSFEATAGDKTYTCTPTISSALADGKFYTSTLTMSESDSSNQYLVFNEEGVVAETPAIGDATAVASSEESVSWSGKYVVSSDVTINGDITLTGDVDLILMDGKTLTVKGCIFGGADYDHGFVYKLNIYGQDESTGKLTVDYSGDHSLGVVTANELNIHGGVITVDGTSVIQGLEPRTLNIYHGTVNATGKSSGIMAMTGGMNIYGGDVTAESIGTEGPSGPAIQLPEGGSTLTISGGNITATSTGGYGIEVVGELIINSGSITVESPYDGITVIDSSDSSKGTITINGGKLDITCTGNTPISSTNITIASTIEQLQLTNTDANEESAYLTQWISATSLKLGAIDAIDYDTAATITFAKGGSDTTHGLSLSRDNNTGVKLTVKPIEE